MSIPPSTDSRPSSSGSPTPPGTATATLDKDEAIQEEVRNAARTLLEAVQARRAGRLVSAGDKLEQPRQK
jgi:hypothetical protein